MSSDSTKTLNDQLLTRHTDIHEKSVPSRTKILPPVNWKGIGQSAPIRLPIGKRNPEDALPSVDIVILTWTSAEWLALDHVFLNSDAQRDFSNDEWRKAWLPYSRGASNYSSDPKSGSLWGFFQLVQITDQSDRPWRVLLFKSNSHLAHSPWTEGLTVMLRCILEDTKPDRIYTIGTAGGSRLDQHLGDVVITNTALLELQRPQNTIDANNGGTFRCPTWFPSIALMGYLERSLLYRMNQVVTKKSLEDLFAQLQAKYSNHPDVAKLDLSDLLNDSIRPEFLGNPKIRSMKDVPLLTTDFYYIAKGDSANAYSFLEMDDAIIAREANRAGVRFACIRNISDPVVPNLTSDGLTIPETMRGDWSGLIYTSFGLQTSYNGALATWAAIAGEGTSVYNPARDTKVPNDDDPLEVKLAFQVRSCGTCSFFWPQEKQIQPYGPYTAFDFDVDVPYPATPVSGSGSSPWVTGRTRPPSFPNGEIVDGCRKAPIMTVGINPNLTAFLPGQTGTAWSYPNFSSDNDTNAWAKYAWYYRYRSVFQERFTLDFVKKFILPQGRIIVPRSGHIVSATRLDDSPEWKIAIRYDGDSDDITITLPGKLGDFPYVLLFDPFPPKNVFAAGDIIAGRLAVPGGIQVEVMQQPQSYYMQFVPVLQKFQDTLYRDGHQNASLRIGEDVCQLDMVACASPHWNKGYLGGTDESVFKIVDNCVTQNAWAIKQIVQTRPAILYIVSESTWSMFRSAFGSHIQRDQPLSEHPADKDFTLLRETTDPDHPCYLVFDVTIDGRHYSSKTRLVITPHFSYNVYFLPQFRVSPDDWKILEQAQGSCIDALTAANGFTIVRPDPKNPDDYVVIQLSSDPDKASASLAWLQEQFLSAYQMLIRNYYDPHIMMASVLNEMYSNHVLTWKDKGDGTGYLDRTEGSCQFCVNRHWQFPNECRYDKTKEEAPPSGFLEKVAERIVATGKTESPVKGTSGK